MKKSKEIYLWISIACFLVIFTGIALLPTLISTPLGTQIALKWVNGSIKGRISLQQIHLAWFGKQRVSNLVYMEAD